MRKRYHTYHHNSAKPAERRLVEDKQPKSILEKHRKPKKVSWKSFLFIAVVLILIVIGYVGISSIKAANNILAQDISFASLIKQSSLKQADGITNILLLGKGGSNHPGGQLTDTIMLARIRQSDKKIALISVPRDLWVTIPGHGQSKINEAYAQGFTSEKDQNKKSDAGAQTTSQIIEKNLGVPVHYYAVVDFTGFKDLVDAVGGITVNVEKDLDDPYYPKDYFGANGYVKTDDYAPLHVKKGTQHMNGELALKYSRSRETTSDFDRAKRQQQVLFAIKEKALSLGVLSNPVKMSDIFGSLGSHIRTSFNSTELKELFDLMKDFDQSKVTNKVLDNSQNGLLVSSDDGSYHLLPKSGNFLEIQKFVKNIFDDETNVNSMVEIEVYNGSKKVGIAGKLAETLKSQGFSVTKIENSDTQYEKTTIMDGTSSSKTYQEIKSVVGEAQRVTSEPKGVIKIYLGADYGS